MVATAKTANGWIDREMKRAYDAAFVEAVRFDWLRYASRHQQLFVKVFSGSIVVYSFHATIRRPEPGIDPIPGA